MKLQPLKLQKFPTGFQSLHVVYAERKFVHFVNGTVIATGTILRATDSENVEAFYLYAGETEEETEYPYVSLNSSALHFDGESRTGFRFGPPVHDYSELPNSKS
jgi:pectin methylesterase-like acyl-CoA thioesterase